MLNGLKNIANLQGDLMPKIFIAEAAEICGVDTRTFRKSFVEKRGYIRPIGKTAWGWDQYDFDEVKALSRRLNKKRKKGHPIEIEEK